MRRLFAILGALAWLCAALPAAAAVTVTNLGHHGTSVTGNSDSVTVTANAGVGETVIVIVTYAATPGTISVSDSAGNTYTKASTTCDFSTSAKLALFYAPVTSALTSGVSTITLSIGTATKDSFTAVTVTGLSATPLDVQGACQINAGSTSASIALTTGSDDGLVVGAMGATASPGTFSANSPFTGITGDHTNIGIDGGYVASPSPSSSVTFAPTWVTSRANAANVWSFHASGGATPTSRPLLLLGVGAQ